MKTKSLLKVKPFLSRTKLGKTITTVQRKSILLCISVCLAQVFKYSWNVIIGQDLCFRLKLHKQANSRNL